MNLIGNKMLHFPSITSAFLQHNRDDLRLVKITSGLPRCLAFPQHFLSHLVLRKASCLLGQEMTLRKRFDVFWTVSIASIAAFNLCRQIWFLRDMQRAHTLSTVRSSMPQLQYTK